MPDLNLNITLTADASDATAELNRVTQAHRALVADLQKKLTSIGAFEAANRDLQKLDAALAEAKRKRDFFLRSAAAGGDAGFKMYRRDIEAATRELQRAQTAADRQRGVVSSLGLALRAAGVDTARLGAEQARLTSQIARAQGAFRFEAAGLQAAQLNAFAGASSRAAAAVRPLGAGLQQTALTATSLKGALRDVGRHMALLAADAYLVHKAMSAVRGVLAVGSDFQRLGATLRFATGTADGAAEALQYIRTTSEALGLPLQIVGDGFAKLAAAAKGTALEGKATRDIFTAVAGASRVMGVSAQDTQGVLLAVSQIMSKGTVSAEELRGQLGERLPGAFQIAARAMGVTTQELGKLLETGQLTATDFLPRFAAELQKSIAGALPEAVRTFDAELARMKNALVEFGNEVAQSGALDAFTQLLREMAAEMREMAQTGELQQMARGLADALGDAAAVLKTLTQGLIEHRDVVLGVVGAYIALRGVMFAAGLVKILKPLVALRPAFDAAALGVRGFSLGLQAAPFVVATAGTLKLVDAMQQVTEAMRSARQNADAYAEAQRQTMAANAQFANRRFASAGTASEAKSQQEALERAEEYWRAKMLLESEQFGEATQATRERLRLARAEIVQARQHAQGLLDIERRNLQMQADVRAKLNADLKAKLDTALALRRAYLDDLKDLEKRRADVESRFGETRTEINAPATNPLIQGTVLETGRTLDQGRAALDEGDYKRAAALAEAAREQIAALAKEGKATKPYLNTLLDQAQQLAAGAGDAELSVVQGNIEAAETAINNLRNQAAALAAIPVGFDGATALQDAAALRAEMEAVLASTPIIVPVLTQADLDAAGSASTDAAQGALGAASGYATGGLVLGPGTDTSDSILARLSRKEYVVKAPSVRSVGVHVMDYINRFGRLPRFALGGLVERAAALVSPAPAAAVAGLPVNIHLGGQSYAATTAPDVGRALVAELRREVLKRGRR